MIAGTAVFPVGRPFLPVGWYHLFFFGLLIPFAAVRSRLRLVGASSVPSRRAHYWSTIILLVACGLFSTWTAALQQIPVLHGRHLEPAALVAGAAVLIAGLLAALPLWRSAAQRRVPTLTLYAPANPSERAMWVAKSVVAGISEEVSWRGVQVSLLAHLLGSVPLAIVVCVAMFTLAHAVQETRSLLLVACFAAAFHLLVWLSGSLLVPIVVHAVYDAVAGLTAGRWVRAAARVGSAASIDAFAPPQGRE